VEDDRFHLRMGGFELEEQVGSFRRDFLTSITLDVRELLDTRVYEFVDENSEKELFLFGLVSQEIKDV
jgi:hypothetical protein